MRGCYPLINHWVALAVVSNSSPWDLCFFETQPWWILDNRGKNIDYEVTELCFQELFFST